MSTYKVKAAETGEIRGDGKGTRTFSAAPKGPGRNPAAGRHSIGAPGGRPGNIRDGQSEPAGNHPITGVERDSPIRSMAPRPSIPANQAETSRDLEARLKANPQPFTYDTYAATMLPGSVKFAEVGVGYEYISDPDAPLSKRGYGVKPMGKQGMEDAASAGGGMPSKGYNPINGGRASWMRKD